MKIRYLYTGKNLSTLESYAIQLRRQGFVAYIELHGNKHYLYTDKSAVSSVNFQKQ